MASGLNALQLQGNMRGSNMTGLSWAKRKYRQGRLASPVSLSLSPGNLGRVFPFLWFTTSGPQAWWQCNTMLFCTAVRQTLQLKYLTSQEVVCLKIYKIIWIFISRERVTKQPRAKKEIKGLNVLLNLIDKATLQRWKKDSSYSSWKSPNVISLEQVLV